MVNIKNGVALKVVQPCAKLAFVGIWATSSIGTTIRATPANKIKKETLLKCGMKLCLRPRQE